MPGYGSSVRIEDLLYKPGGLQNTLLLQNLIVWTGFCNPTSSCSQRDGCANSLNCKCNWYECNWLYIQFC